MAIPGTEIVTQGTEEYVAEELEMSVSEVVSQVDGNYFYGVSTTSLNDTIATLEARAEVRSRRPGAVDIAEASIITAEDIGDSFRKSYIVLVGLDLKL